MNSPLAPGLIVRRPTLADLPATTAMIQACDVAESGSIDFSQEELEQNWTGPDFDLNRDAWLVTTAEGQIIGHACLWRMDTPQVQSYGNTHPKWNGQGVGTFLAQAVEARAREYLAEHSQAEPVALNTYINNANQAAAALLVDNGYQTVRFMWRMQIKFEQEPAPVEMPDGFSLRQYQPGQDDYTVYEAYEEAFADHWGHIRRPFEVWLARQQHVDPALWFLAFEGNQLAGFALCSDHSGLADVNLLGVRRDWRGRGLAMALLRHSFQQFYRRGQREVRLGVDSENQTGATRLYLRAGMNIERQYATYRKLLS